ncbi:MAG: acyl-CoA dehydrogenase family protein [Deltaproteobacteria bacterium]|nr:acyl-CoA dehydrogenase family protein [Deltaproteobacteria bacterium]MBW2419620.1 acyl-CoA dehydrogenase family protein [Deltaproteobacteria bacterium]
MSDLDAFRQQTRAWLEENCPPARRTLQPGETAPKWGTPEFDAEVELWSQRMGDKGWTTPTWPREYGGGGLSKEEARILGQEMRDIGTFSPVGGFGLALLGPVLLEFATEEQKQRFLPDIIRGRVQWCQGYSEPGAGSDLAGLQTSAVQDGDEYVINGQKIWTTSAHLADWIFCLVRTDPAAPKHDGISFILFDMKSPGVSVSPIQLISGQSDFCQIFFDDVRAKAENLVPPKNGGWTIAKRLLQHERSGLSGMMGGGAGGRKRTRGGERVVPTFRSFADLAEPYLGRDEQGRLADLWLRDQIAQLEMDGICFGLTLKRSGEAARAGQDPGHAVSMSKFYASEANKRRQELMVSVMGTQGLGWEGEGFSPDELAQARSWLRSKGNSIEGGTTEIQLNVIAKRVLGLPD